MPNQELIKPEGIYLPQFNNLNELANNLKRLVKEQEILEMAHLRYADGKDTVSLITEIKNLKLGPKMEKSLIDTLAIVASSDYPEDDIDTIGPILSAELDIDYRTFLNEIDLVKNYKKTLH